MSRFVTKHCGLPNIVDNKITTLKTETNNVYVQPNEIYTLLHRYSKKVFQNTEIAQYMMTPVYWNMSEMDREYLKIRRYVLSKRRELHARQRIFTFQMTGIVD